MLEHIPLIYYTSAALLNFITSFAVLVFVFFKNIKSRTNQTFSLFAFTITGWSLCYFLWLSTGKSYLANIYLRTLMLFVIFIPTTFTHFVLTLLKVDFGKRINLGNYLISSFLGLTVYSQWFANDIGPFLVFPYWLKPRLFFYLHSVHFFANVIYSHYLMIRALKHYVGTFRNQILYVLIGTAIGYTSGAINYLTWCRIPIPPFLNPLVSIYVVTMGYAIIRHRLMDIKVVIKKTLVYSILISAITIIYIVTALFVEHILKGIIGYKSLPITIFTITLLVIVFQPLKNYIQRIIDRFFFHGSIDQINAENIRLRDELQKTEKLKAVATLAAGMAHEIKNPLTGIKTFTEYLPKKHNNPDFIKKFQKIVGSEVDRINYIVKQLLEFAKPSELKLRETDINKLLDETSDLLNNHLLKFTIKIEKIYSTLPQIQIDPVQMKQVFLNIFLNAIDSMHNGGILTIKTEIKENNRISIGIKDTGKGIEKEDLKHIFDPFFSKKDGGTGLGLNVVHGIVTKHSGKINVTSTPGKCTCFEIIMPVS